jgi:methanogenic corrinoid protein MtbC1
VWKWCCCCQQFMREVPDYDDFAITHGICAPCRAKGFPFSVAGGLGHAVFLRDIFRERFEAGQNNDLEEGRRIVEKAVAASCRPVDILIGMIAPMLYRIGEDWKRGELSVEGEHRFTAFCEKVLELVEAKIGADEGAVAEPARHVPVLLMNAPGNEHTLASRILALWLQSRGIAARIAGAPGGADALLEEVEAILPGSLLISMALVEQRDDVAAIVNRCRALPQSIQPRIVVGGYAVKAGLVTVMPGADVASDISTLSFA